MIVTQDARFHLYQAIPGSLHWRLVALLDPYEQFASTPSQFDGSSRLVWIPSAMFDERTVIDTESLHPTALAMLRGVRDWQLVVSDVVLELSPMDERLNIWSLQVGVVCI